jgi:hypothetical protein
MHMQELLDHSPPVPSRHYPGEKEVKEYHDAVVEAEQILAAARDRGGTDEKGGLQRK